MVDDDQDDLFLTGVCFRQAVFMFSTSSSESDRRACLAAGAKDYFLKPSGLTQMRSFVEAVSKNLDLKQLSIAS